MTKLVRNQGINVSGSLRLMEAGDFIVFPKRINEITIRNACTRIKNATGQTYTVNRQKDGTHHVTRTN